MGSNDGSDVIENSSQVFSKDPSLPCFNSQTKDPGVFLHVYLDKGFLLVESIYCI